MITKENGSYRVRADFGLTPYRTKLFKTKELKEKKLSSLAKNKALPEKDKHIMASELKAEITRAKKEIDIVEANMKAKFGTLDIKTRRSYNCVDIETAKKVEELFKQAKDEEVTRGFVSRDLEDRINEIVDVSSVDSRKHYLEEVANLCAKFVSYDERKLKYLNYKRFLSKAPPQINQKAQDSLGITQEEVILLASKLCVYTEKITLKGKTYLFTGAFSIEDLNIGFIRSLGNLAKSLKVDGILLNGRWSKNNFDINTFNVAKIEKNIRSLTSKYKVIAIRTSIDDVNLVSFLKSLGVNFVNQIEDEKNLFLGYEFSNVPRKNQIAAYKDLDKEKNLFVHTSYVSLEQVVKKDTLVYIIGSGSSSINSPAAKIGSFIYNSDELKSSKYSK